MNTTITIKVDTLYLIFKSELPNNSTLRVLRNIYVTTLNKKEELKKNDIYKR